MEIAQAWWELPSFDGWWLASHGAHHGLSYIFQWGRCLLSGLILHIPALKGTLSDRLFWDSWQEGEEPPILTSLGGCSEDMDVLVLSTVLRTKLVGGLVMLYPLDTVQLSIPLLPKAQIPASSPGFPIPLLDGAPVSFVLWDLPKPFVGRPTLSPIVLIPEIVEASLPQ